MTVRRIMGIETEYGVLQPGRPLANPMLLSSHVVAVHAAAREGARAKARWDYDDEDPLKDARGFHLQRASAHPSLLTDDPARPAPSGDGGASRSPIIVDASVHAVTNRAIATTRLCIERTLAHHALSPQAPVRVDPCPAGAVRLEG